MKEVATHAAVVGVVALCLALGVPRATYYRQVHPEARRRPSRRVGTDEPPPDSSESADALLESPGAPREDEPPPPSPCQALVPASPRALALPERQQVLATLNSERFCDLAPAEVYAELLDEGTYLCSVRTMYRILHDNREVRERRNQLRHPAYAKPELVATAPNQVWSWDITKLKTFVSGVYLHLYVILDLYSRYVVGWLLADKESGELAKQLVAETCEKHNVAPAQLWLHSDRGTAMTSQPLSQLLARLDVAKSFSRPHVSDDNPFSESQFKTLKYHPTFPQRFNGLADGLEFCRTFIPWYNDQHHHSALRYLTPADAHYSRADDILRRRHSVLMAAFHAHPDRFFHKPPLLKALPPAVYINPPKEAQAQANTPQASVNSPHHLSHAP